MNDLTEIANLVTEYPNEFVLGIIESEGDVGMTYDDDPDGPRSGAYDLGRTLGRAAQRRI
jgi:hypothetical protein